MFSRAELELTIWKVSLNGSHCLKYSWNIETLPRMCKFGECPNTLGTMKSDMVSDEESEWAMLAGTLKATQVVY
jgi:hypothetical protein